METLAACVLLFLATAGLLYLLLEHNRPYRIDYPERDESLWWPR